MQVKVSIIIPSYNRAHLLKWNLFSLAKQKIPLEYEVIVLNDGLPDDTETVCSQYQQKLNLRYIFTGQRNSKDKMLWRSPGFAINIAAKIASGEILIICDAEIFHVNKTINILSLPLKDNPKLIAHPSGINDIDGSILNMLKKDNNAVDYEKLSKHYPPLKTYFPFLWAINRKEFIYIGGYDEEFEGIAIDDLDLRDRLMLNGCSLFPTDAQIIHLFHRNDYGSNIKERRDANYNLYQKKQGLVIRNHNHDWGNLDK